MKCGWRHDPPLHSPPWSVEGGGGHDALLHFPTWSVEARPLHRNGLNCGGGEILERLGG